jgi:hypothetical protein
MGEDDVPAIATGPGKTYDGIWYGVVFFDMI